MNKIRRSFIPLVILLVVSLGCGFSLGGTKTAPPPAATPSNAGEAGETGGEAVPPTAEAQSEGGKGGEKISLSSLTEGLQTLDSYRSHLEMTFEDAESGEQQVVEMEIEVVREPFAQRTVVHNSNTGEQIEIIQVGDRQYYLAEEGCFSISAEDTEEAEIINPDDVVGDMEDLTRVMPDEDINGVRCQHYTFDESSLVDEGLSSAQGDVWIAADGGYVVKYTMQAEGKDPETGQEGHIEITYQVSEINKPLTIEVPESCQGNEDQYPIMSDATNMATMAGMVSYETASSFDDVLAFYQEQMPAQGWTDAGDSFISEGTAMLNYTKDGESVTVTISEGDGVVSVMLIGE